VKNFFFRLSKPADYPQIKLLAESVWSHDYLIDGFFEILNDRKSHFLVVESDDHEILGCINALIYTFNNKRIGYLETLRVRADAHNQGIGTLITKKAFRYLESKHIAKIGYVTGLRNQSSIQIALKNGFTQIARWPAALLDCTQLVRLPFYERKSPNNSELSTTEILQIIENSKIGWFNCHWEFFPLSVSLIDYLKDDGKALFIRSQNKLLLSYVNQYGTHLVGNIIGKPNKTAFMEIIAQIRDQYNLTEYEEIRLFIQENYQPIYSNISFMDFSKKKGVLGDSFFRG
jgi:N-acetylglutamate synthase-like GNAT family acetyltransferase